MAWCLQCFRHHHLGPDASSSKHIIIYKNIRWLRAVLLKDKYSASLQYTVITHFRLMEISTYRFLLSSSKWDFLSICLYTMYYHVRVF